MASFQYENLILPDNEPILLVNRDWQIPGKRARKGRNTAQVQTGGGQIHTFRINPMQTGSSSKARPETSQRPKSKQRAARQTAPAQRTRPQDGMITFSLRKEPVTAQRSSLRQQSESASSEEHPSPEIDIETIETTSLDSEEYGLITSSRAWDQTGGPSKSGIGVSLLQLANFNTPDFISKANFLNFYVTGVADYMYPLKGRYTLNPLPSVWLPIVLVDELWFYCIMYTVVRHLHADPAHRSYDRECVYLVDIIYSKLRGRLEAGANGEGLTDVDCAAVSCLLGVEHGFGTAEGAAQHARGLASFVSKRGGIHRVSGILRNKICRADVESAIDHSTLPILPPVHEDKLLSTQLGYFGPQPLFIEYDELMSYPSSATATAAVDFFTLVSYLERQTRGGKLIDPFTLDDSVLNIQYRLASLSEDALPPPDKAFRAACMIFIKCLIRPIGVVADRSLCKVKTICATMRTDVEIPRAMRTWLLFIGLIGAQPLCRRRIELSSKVVDDFKSRYGMWPAWDAVKKELKEVAWVDAIFDGVGETIWRELDAVAWV